MSCVLKIIVSLLLIASFIIVSQETVGKRKKIYKKSYTEDIYTDFIPTISHDIIADSADDEEYNYNSTNDHVSNEKTFDTWTIIILVIAFIIFLSTCSWIGYILYRDNAHSNESAELERQKTLQSGTFERELQRIRIPERRQQTQFNPDELILNNIPPQVTELTLRAQQQQQQQQSALVQRGIQDRQSIIDIIEYLEEKVFSSTRSNLREL